MGWGKLAGIEAGVAPLVATNFDDDLHQPEFDSPHPQPLSHIGRGAQETSNRNHVVVSENNHPVSIALSN